MVGPVRKPLGARSLSERVGSPRPHFYSGDFYGEATARNFVIFRLIVPIQEVGKCQRSHVSGGTLKHCHFSNGIIEGK